MCVRVLYTYMCICVYEVTIIKKEAMNGRIGMGYMDGFRRRKEKGGKGDK